MSTPTKAKGRADVKKFVQLYQDLLWHPNYIKLTPRAIKLMNDLMAQYNGNNNGDLSACMALMGVRGWASKSSLHLALRELIPVSKSGWWLGIKDGRFPRGVKLGKNTTAWRVEDIRELISKLSEQC